MRNRTVYSPFLHQGLEDPSVGFPAHAKLRDWVSLCSAAERESWVPVPAPVSVETVLKVHAPHYVGDVEREQPALALAARWAVAAHVYAMKAATAGDPALVCAPVSGFHHAGYRAGGGFCLYNGLITTLAAYRAMGLTGRVLILDGDAHFGNGTSNLLGWRDYGAVTHLSRDVQNERDAGAPFDARWLMHVAAVVRGQYALVLYQAGADAWEEDSYGSGWLSRRELMLRDRGVFDACVKSATPCVWNFAGGYNGAPSAAIHAETALQASLACQDHALAATLASAG